MKGERAPHMQGASRSGGQHSQSCVQITSCSWTYLSEGGDVSHETPVTGRTHARASKPSTLPPPLRSVRIRNGSKYASYSLRMQRPQKEDEDTQQPCIISLLSCACAWHSTARAAIVKDGAEEGNSLSPRLSFGPKLTV
eukprot:1157317-Pelagomonas_calceolata.AAC.6